MQHENNELPLRFLITEVASPGRLHGRLLSGRISQGESIVAIPTGEAATIVSIKQSGEPCNSATAASNFTLELDQGTKASAGDMLSNPGQRPEFAHQFEARLDWLDANELLPGRDYLLNAAGGSVQGSVSKLKYRLDAQQQQIAATTLKAGQHGVGNIALTRPIIYDPASVCRANAGFQLLDLETRKLVATGEIRHGLRRASNIHWQALDVDRSSRAAIKRQTPRVIWLTGLSGAGKSAIANMVEKKLLGMHRHSYLLDGDNVRHGLNKDLGFTEADRVENIRRVAETAKLMLDAGLIVITSFISPFRAEREMARQLFAQGEFIEVFVDTSLAVCESRDPKGLYKKARAGELKNFTGIDSPYEAPTNPEIVIDTVALSIEEAADRIIEIAESTPVAGTS